MAITRLDSYGGPRPPYGSFGPKAAASGSSKGQQTRLGLYGGPRQLYGDCTKTPSAPVGKGQQTRLGLYGGPRQLQGAHYPKTPAVAPEVPDILGGTDWVPRARRRELVDWDNRDILDILTVFVGADLWRQ